MSLANLYPTIRPSLVLDFARTKALDPRITFTRATTARYYDGTTTAKAEENLCLRSQEFNGSGWATSGVSVTANSTTAPDGTTTADSFIASATTGAHELYQSITLISGVPYTMSVYAKKDTHDFLQVRFFAVVGGATRFADFDLALGTIGTVGADATATMTAVGGGWYRCTVTASPTGTAGGVDLWLVSSSTATTLTANFAAAGTESVFLWGAQLERRGAVCAYAPTTTAAVSNAIPALVTAPAGVARFDHDPVTGESLGFRVESAKTNLLLQSEDFSTTWTKVLATVDVNANVAPDGTLTADRLVEDTTASENHLVQQSVTKAASALTYTLSVYAKSGGRNVRLSFDNGSGTNNVQAMFDLTAGTAAAASAGGTFTALFSSIQSVGNGWYRCSVTGTTDTGTTVRPSVWLLSGTSATYTGDGYAHAYLWGAQLESGLTLTSYIPTTTASATRNADVATMTGANFSSWWRNDEGTILIENNYDGGSNRDGGGRVVIQIDDGGNSYRHLIYNTNNIANRWLIVLAGVTSSGHDAGPTSSAAMTRTLAAFKASSVASSYSGRAVVPTTPAIMPTCVQMGIGCITSTLGAQLIGTIKRFAFFPARLTDAQLRALSQQ